MGRSETEDINLKEINEHDLVTATSIINKIPIGAIGTVIHTYSKGKVYEVEFAFEGKYNIMETVRYDEIKKCE